MEENLDTYIKKLNSPDYTLGKMYRRSKNVYELISYTNNLIGCYLSQNYETAAIFIRRARKFMNENPSSEYNVYYGLANEFYNHLESYLKTKDIVVNNES